MNRFRYKRAAANLKQRSVDTAVLQRLSAIEDRIEQIGADLGHANAHATDVLAHLEHQIHAIRQLVGPFVATFPDGSMLCQSIHEVKYFVDPDDRIITPQMVVYRQWEADLSRLFRHICTPDTVLVDVGANFGYFTCLGGNLIGNSGRGRVFAFEPNPKLVKLLYRNVDINWSMAPIDIHPVAVANFKGTATLLIPDNQGANATLSASAGGKSGETVEIATVRLDDVIPADLAVDILKVDVEGHELNVLLGAREMIARSPAIKIVMEWSIPQMRDAGIDAREIVGLLDGFGCYDADRADPYAERHDPEWLLERSYVNALLQRD